MADLQRAGWRLCRAAFWLLAVAPVLASAQPAVLQGIELVDQHARALRPASLAGRPVLLHFVFTGCSSVCPTQVAELAAVRATLPLDVRGQLALLSVTIDPVADTPERLATYAQRLGASHPGWSFATGRPATVALLTDRMQVLARTPATPARREDHRTSLYLFDASGSLVQRYRGVPVDGPRLRDDITRVVRHARTVRTAVH